MSNIILTDAAGTPQRSHNAQMSTKIYFWFNCRTGHILSGAPPRWDKSRPPGYETIECAHAYEVESWSRRLNEQEKRKHDMSEIERYEAEKPMIDDLRRELKKQLFDIEKNKNKGAAAMMLKRNVKKLDKFEKNFFSTYDSRMHVEGYEDGK